jgi:hypothetical protein
VFDFGVQKHSTSALEEPNDFGDFLALLGYQFAADAGDGLEDVNRPNADFSFEVAVEVVAAVSVASAQ